MSSNPKANPPLNSRERVLLEFQRTSLALTLGFLESQQRVMMAYLTGSASLGAEAGSYPAPLENTLSHPLLNVQQLSAGTNLSPEVFAAMQAQQQAAMQAQQQATMQAQQQAAMQAQQQAAMQAQQQAAMQAQQQAAMQTQASAVQTTQTTVNGNAASSNSEATANPEELITALIDIVSQRTGYPPEMLEPTLDLEADLGIDSIKRVEILNGFRKMLPESSQLSLESGIEQLATVKTLQGIMDWIRTEFSTNKPNPTIESNNATSQPGGPTASVIVAASGSNGSPSNASTNGDNGTYSNGSNGNGKLSNVTSGTSTGTAAGARLKSARTEKLTQNSTLFTISMNCEEDRFLNDHLFDGVPVMPMAVALELMLEASTSSQPTHRISEVKDLEILAGIVFDSKNTDIHVLVETTERSDDSITVKASVQTSGKVRRTHFRASIVLVPSSTPIALTAKQKGIAALPPNFRGVQILEPLSPTELPSAADVYQNFMFHGPLFQGITAVSTMGSNGVAGSIQPLALSNLLANPGAAEWLINPTLLDSSMQLAGVWARHNMDVTVLPAGFKQLKIHGPLNGKTFNSLVMISPETKGLEIKCDLGIYSEDNELVLSIEGLKGIGSKALNRLSSRESEPVA